MQVKIMGISILGACDPRGPAPHKTDAEEEECLLSMSGVKVFLRRCVYKQQSDHLM